MFSTSNMGLQAWDLESDPYDHSELANNWVAVDGHDHSASRGAQIPTGGLVNAAVTTPKIADDAVVASKIPDGSIIQSKLANNSVGAPQIIDGAVGTPELADHSVTAAKLDPKLYIIGEVIQWYRPNTSISLPVGLEPCDGRPWSSIPNAWGVTSGNIPDLRNKFILGAALTNNGTGTSQNPDIGQAGGSHTTDLTHSHSISGLSHTHSIGSDGSHTHTTDSVGAHTHSITAGGIHNHDFNKNATSGTGPLYTRNLGTNASELTPTLFVTAVGAGTESIHHPGSDSDPGNIGESDSPITMANNGSHDHGGATGSNGTHSHVLSTTGSHSHGGATGAGTVSGSTDSQLSTLDKRPAYVGLIFLMRVL